jgi:succinate dehydrogenase/fumarate reductase flavoprotein subunit
MLSAGYTVYALLALPAITTSPDYLEEISQILNDNEVPRIAHERLRAITKVYWNGGTAGAIVIKASIVIVLVNACLLWGLYTNSRKSPGRTGNGVASK